MKCPTVLRKMSSFVVCFCAAASSQERPSKGNPYEPIPSKFEIPAKEAELEAWVETSNIKALRRHGWEVLSGVTYASRNLREGNEGPLPIWETWYSYPEVFQPPSTTPPTLTPFFEYPPKQLAPLPEAPARVVSVASRILFNQEARDHIQRNCLYLESKLECMLKEPKKVDAQGKAVPREVPDFPRGSVTVKTAWMHVSQKCTPIPVWNPDSESLQSTTHAPANWKNVVWVYPPTVSPSSCPSKDPVALDRFYHFKIVTAKEVENWQKAGNVLLDPASGELKPSDYVILVGLHAATRELPNWVWTTFWWHNRPKEGPFGSDRPASIHGVWRNYLMDVAYDMDRPKEHDLSPKVAFNPYLEGGLAEGTHSNCMACHRRAVLPNKPNVVTLYSFGDEVQQNQIVVRGTEAATATYLPDFDDRLKLHFVWSLISHSEQPAVPDPLPTACGCSKQP